MKLAQEATLLCRGHLQLAEKKMIPDQSREKLLTSFVKFFFVLSSEENADTFIR